MTEDHITPRTPGRHPRDFPGTRLPGLDGGGDRGGEGWRCRLEETGDLDLASIAENLGELETLLAADHLDAAAVGQP